MSRSAGWRRLVGAVPLGTSVAAGTVAFVAGYVLTAAVLFVDGLLTRVLDGGGGGSEVPDQVLGFLGALFYNAHFVALRVESSILSGSYDLISQTDLVLPGVVYNAVPIGLLVLGGAVVALRAGDHLTSWTSGALVGTTVVVAYLPLVVLGTQVFGFSGVQSGFDYTVSTPVRTSVIRAGVVLPLICGAVGGAIAHRLRR